MLFYYYIHVRSSSIAISRKNGRSYLVYVLYTTC